MSNKNNGLEEGAPKEREGREIPNRRAEDLKIASTQPIEGVLDLNVEDAEILHRDQNSVGREIENPFSSDERTQAKIQPNIINIISRINISEILTLLIAIASLAVSYLTYINSKNAHEMTEAILAIRNLAAQTKIQADQTKAQADQTAQLVLPTKAQAATATKMLDATQENFRIETRPLVSSTSHAGEELTYFPDLGLGYNVYFKNYGKTTAYNIHFTRYIKMGDEPYLQSPGHSSGTYDLPPAGEFFITALYSGKLEPARMQEIANTRTPSVKVKVVLKYSDDSGHQYTEVICHVSNPKGALANCTP